MPSPAKAGHYVLLKTKAGHYVLLKTKAGRYVLLKTDPSLWRCALLAQVQEQGSPLLVGDFHERVEHLVCGLRAPDHFLIGIGIFRIS